MKPYETGRKRKIKKEVRLSDIEWKAVQKRMQMSGISSFSDYGRQMLINGYVVVIDDSKELKEFTYEINKIGHNINQIAHVANSCGSVSEETINIVIGLMNNIWQFQRYILSATPSSTASTT
jgi:hypothetical protein